MNSFYLPKIGKSSADGGRKSDMTSKNTAWDSNTVTSSDTFSPLSDGNKKPK